MTPPTSSVPDAVSCDGRTNIFQRRVTAATCKRPKTYTRITIAPLDRTLMRLHALHPGKEGVVPTNPPSSERLQGNASPPLVLLSLASSRLTRGCIFDEHWQSKRRCQQKQQSGSKHQVIDFSPWDTWLLRDSSDYSQDGEGRSKWSTKKVPSQRQQGDAR